jgi:hypothetical protein
MIWLAWRRHRLSLLVIAGSLLVLGIWMILVGHSLDVAAHHRLEFPRDTCIRPVLACYRGEGWLNAENQATVINGLLFVVPCLLGIVLGAPSWPESCSPRPIAWPGRRVSPARSGSSSSCRSSDRSSWCWSCSCRWWRRAGPVASSPITSIWTRSRGSSRSYSTSPGSSRWPTPSSLSRSGLLSVPCSDGRCGPWWGRSSATPAPLS